MTHKYNSSKGQSPPVTMWYKWQRIWLENWVPGRYRASVTSRVTSELVPEHRTRHEKWALALLAVRSARFLTE